MDRPHLELQERLYYAAASGDISGMHAAIHAGADVNGTWTDDDGTPLAGAVRSRSFAVAQFLIDQGAEPNRFASELLLLLVEHGRGRPPLADEARIGHAARVLACGADINTEKLGCGTPLSLAAQYRDSAMLRWLLDRGADPSHFDQSGNFALHAAARAGFVSGARALVKAGLGVDATRREDQRTPLHHAAAHARGEQSSDGVGGSKAEIVRALIALGASASARDDLGRTPLQLAACDACGGTGAILELLRAGADVNSVDRLGNTPVGTATLFGMEDGVRALVGAGGSVDLPNGKRLTPLHKPGQRLLC